MPVGRRRYQSSAAFESSNRGDEKRGCEGELPARQFSSLLRHREIVLVRLDTLHNLPGFPGSLLAYKDVVPGYPEDLTGMKTQPFKKSCWRIRAPLC